MPSLTTNYNFYLPLVNDPTDEDLWGGYLNDNFTSLDTIINALASATPETIPAGIIDQYAGDTAPSGWLECTGAAVSRVTYATLFAAVGTKYGIGDGSTTFNLPLTERKVLVGRGGTGTAILANTIGATGGTETHTLSASEMPVHSHSSITLPVAEADNPNPPYNGAVIGHNSPNGGYATYSGGSTGTSTAGSGAAHNNIQPSLVMMMIIKT